MGELVNVDNFARAETARMFDGILAQSGGVNQWNHMRAPVPLDRQAVIRMNRDTLYSSAIVDISGGARLTIPEMGDRYVSAEVVDEDHYATEILHEPGEYELTADVHGTPWVQIAVRSFVEPQDPDDVAAVNAFQDGLALDAASATPYTHPDYDTDSLDATRGALLKLAEGLQDARGLFGARPEVDPVRHLIGTAFGWGGLPEHEAFYVIEGAPRPVGHHRMRFRDVPVDAFWSISIYNRDGYFEANPYDSYSLNNVTTEPDEDGTVTIDLDSEDRGYTNHLYVMDGWNYALRFYRPRPALLDGTWSPPAPEPVED